MDQPERPITDGEIMMRLNALVQQGVSLQTDPIYCRVMLEHLCGDDLDAVKRTYYKVLSDTIDSIEKQLAQRAILSGVYQNGKS